MIIIGGTTGSGKSRLAVELAKEINGEIVSADSMQIYKYMDIGTAKVTETEKDNIPHYMIDIIEPNENYSLSNFTTSANKIIEEIKNRGKTPIIVGGTGLYINSLIYSYSIDGYNGILRKELESELAEKGKEFMYEKLITLDPLCIGKIHQNNTKRVIRAIEVYIESGKSITLKEDKKTAIPHLMYAFDIERSKLYEKINERVDIMFKNGLIDEINALINTKKLTFDMQSMAGIGYKEFEGYFEGTKTIEETKDLIKQHTRNYAKRQITWFKSLPTCTWLSYERSLEENIKIIKNDYEKFKISEVKNDI